MKMAKKREPVNRLHWGWAENYTPGCISDADVKTAYRLNNKTHRPNTCRKNCKGNPNCLSGFGEHNWNQVIDKEAELETYISSKQRTPGTYVGLKNLGNTCYINSLLQLWFHNIPFREAVYGWNALEDRYEIAKHLETFNRDIDLNNYQPLSSIAHLQYLFGEMQFGLTKYCDPEAFCRSLSIDVELQQDAQEFNKLYMQTLEDSFQTSSNPKTKQIIQTRFQGKYSYITRCCSCKYESTRPSFFYELELKVKNCHTILESLQDFLSEEELTGDNQYFCSNCNKKQDAMTGIRLQQLPPVLQLQLLRYEIDAAQGTRRKIHSAIQFPDNLDMSSYLGCPPNTHMYKLNAVLMHGGSTAYSGHYYAHINTAEGWHIFDDINVKKQKYLNLTNEEVVSNADKKSSGPKLKGFRSSTSVYMLVYTRVDEKESTGSASQSANVKVASKSGKSADKENQNTEISKSSEVNQAAEIKVGEERGSGVDESIKKSPTIKQEKASPKEIEIKEAPTQDPFISSNGDIQVPSPDANQTEVNNVNDVNGVNGVNVLNGVNIVNNCNDKRSQVLKENTTDNVMRDDSFIDTSIGFSKEDFFDNFQEEKTVLNYITNLKNSEFTYQNSKNLIWSKFKFSSPQFSEQYGKVYIVFEKKLLNHPMLKKKGLEDQLLLDESGLMNVSTENFPITPEKKQNGTLSPVCSNSGDFGSKDDNSLVLENGIESINLNVSVVSDSDKVRTEKNENDPVGSGEKNVSSGCGDSDNQNETFGNDDNFQEGNKGEKGGGDGEKSHGNGDGDNPKDLEFLDKPEGSLNLRSKLDAAHWEMLSGYLKSALLKSREEFKKNLESQETEINQKIELQNVIKTISETLTPEPESEDYEFINFEWLKSITKLPSTPVDNSILLCKHGKLDVSLKKQYKVISKKAADFLYEHFSGGPRLTSESLCRTCVENQAKKYKLNMEVTKDSKLMNQLSKQLIEQHHPAYWVGKKSLKSWTNYALQGNEDDEVDDDDESESLNTVKENVSCENKPEVKLEPMEIENAKERLNDQPKPETSGEITSGAIPSFNDDIVCIHGGLIVDENERKLVSQAAWNVFVKYFPNCKVFDRNHPPCPDCQVLARQDKKYKDSVREKGMYEKDVLRDLFERKPNWDMVSSTFNCYLVDSEFVAKWRKYVKSVQKTNVLDAPLMEEMINPLLCQLHGLLLYDPNREIDRFFPLTQYEWEILQNQYMADRELTVSKSETGNLVTSIDLCTECMTERLHAEEEEILENSYSNATISVYKLVTNVDDGDSEDNDEGVTKKRKLNNKKAKDAFPPAQSLKKIAAAPEQVRRSARARQSNKDRKVFNINKFTTLMDLKKAICKKFNVLPIDQHLSINGIDLDVTKESLQLSDEDATLMNLQVKPNASIQLVADEPYADANMQDDVGFMLPEAGFKGTELGGR